MFYVLDKGYSVAMVTMVTMVTVTVMRHSVGSYVTEVTKDDSRTAIFPSHVSS